jgi:multidrug efflux system outer membrane protein
MAIYSCSPLRIEKPDILVPERYKNATSTSAVTTDLNQWWKDFNDENLNRLVQEALRNNHDIRLAIERVIEARANVGIKRADLFPTIDVKANISRQKQTFITSQSGKRASTLINTYSFTPVASYELDLWGKLSSSEKAAYEKLIASEENKKTVVHTVVADLVTLYLEKVGLERKIAVIISRIKNSKRSLELINRRYRRGLSTYIDLLQAKSHLAETEARLPALKRQLMDLAQRISILMGRYPDSLSTEVTGIDYIGTLQPIKPGLPSELLLRRPDIRAMEAQMRAVFEELKVARARRFPIITLTGSYGWTSDELRNLFKPDSLLWQISTGVLQPLFDAGKLKTAEKAAQSRYRQSIISYGKTVLQAFYEVESALVKRQRLYEEREHLINLLNAAQKTYRAAQSRYERGLVDLLRVLELERLVFQTKERLIDVETTILTNRVFLYRALGGTWTDTEES